MIRLGGPVYLNKNEKGAGARESHSAAAVDPDLLIKAHKAKGWQAAYAPAVSINDTDLIKAYREAFAAADIMIAEVGYWNNLIDTDSRTRTGHQQEMVEALAVAEELGACCAVDIFGSYCHGGGQSIHTEKNFSLKAFDEAVEMARYFIDQVKPQRTTFAYEIFPFNVIDSPGEIARLIKAVNREAFGVHLDLANLINCPRAYWTSGDIIRECIKLFGDKIVSAHAKDIKLKEPAISVILEEVLPGTGGLDISSYITELEKLPQQVPLMLEHLASEEEYDLAAAHYRGEAKKSGITI